MKAHLINCTYCVHRMVTPGDKKRSISEAERCRLTMLMIKHPSQSGRYCEEFHQIGHDCLDCIAMAEARNAKITMVRRLDKVSEL